MMWTADVDDDRYRSLQHNGDLVEVFCQNDGGGWGFGVWLNTPAQDEDSFHDQVVSGARSAAGVWQGGGRDYLTAEDAKRAADDYYRNLQNEKGMLK